MQLDHVAQLLATYIAVRGSLFTGFLSLGGLILATLSFMGARLHEYYRGDFYLEETSRLRAHYGEEEVGVAEGLQVMVDSSAAALRVSFAVAGLQLLPGLFVVGVLVGDGGAPPTQLLPVYVQLACAAVPLLAALAGLPLLFLQVRRALQTYRLLVGRFADEVNGKLRGRTPRVVNR